MHPLFSLKAILLHAIFARHSHSACYFPLIPIHSCLPPRGAEASPYSSHDDLGVRGSLPSLLLPRDPEVQISYGLDRLQTTEVRERRNSVPDDFKPPRVPDLWETSQIEWERGRPDYLGVNAFDEIRRRLDETMGERMNYDYDDPSGSQSAHDGGGGEKEGEVEGASEEEDRDSVDEPPPPPDDRHSWEVGQPDYMGRASFDFILKRMAATIGRGEIVETKRRKEMEMQGEVKDISKKSSSDDAESTSPPLIVPKRRVHLLGSRGSVVDTASKGAVFELDLPFDSMLPFSGPSSPPSPALGMLFLGVLVCLSTYFSSFVLRS